MTPNPLKAVLIAFATALLAPTPWSAVFAALFLWVAVEL